MRPLNFATWTSSEPLFCRKLTGKSKLVGCLPSLKAVCGLSVFGSTIMMGRVFPPSSGCLPSCRNSNTMSWSNPRGKERCPINSIYKNHLSHRKSLSGSNEFTHFPHIPLLPLIKPKVNLWFIFIPIWRVQTIVILIKIQCTTAHKKNNHPARGKNSIALGLLNKPTKARKFKVKFYTPSLTPRYCEREIKGTMVCVRGAMSAVTALPGFYWLVS